MKIILFVIAVGVALLSVPAMTKDVVHTKQVHFDKGTNGTTVQGSIKGYETVNYKLGAKADQSMRVSLESKKAFINIFEPDKDPGNEAMFIGSMAGASYVGILPKSGTYTIQVYLMRNEARRDTKINYKLHIGVD